MNSVATVKSQIHTVSDEQIGKCHAAIGPDGVTYYMVESESDNLVEYKVQYSHKTGFTCSCKSGQVGFSNTRNGFCKHCVWALATAEEVRHAVAEMEAPAAAIEAPVAAPLKPMTGKEKAFYLDYEARQAANTAFFQALPSRKA